jgi:hypothetical protein
MEQVPEQPEHGETPEAKAERKHMTADIAACQSFDKLYEVIGTMGTVIGSHRTYPASKVIEYIERVRSEYEHYGEVAFIGPTFHAVTGTAGIREKVRQLLKSHVQ